MSMVAPPMIMGYYPYIRNGTTHPPRTILGEIRDCLLTNSWYRDEMIFLAADSDSARMLTSHGLRVVRSFEDAPDHVRRNAAHRMKHWMSIWALREFGEYLWVDWDTVSVRKPDDDFWSACRNHDTPKFVLIPGYKHARVNCGLVYANATWLDRMETSLNVMPEVANDELLWDSILPNDVQSRSEYWWDGEVMFVGKDEKIDELPSNLVFAHVGDLAWASRIRKVCRT